MRNKEFFKEYTCNIKNLDNVTLTQQEYDYQMIYVTAAYRVYQILRKHRIKRYWKDSKGYPLNKDYYSKNLIVCSISIRKLSVISGFSTKTTQKHLNQLKAAGWIKVSEKKVKDGQKVYILGHWSNKDDKYIPTFLNEEMTIKVATQKSKFEGTYTEIDKTVW